MKITVENPEAFVRRMFFLAWRASSVIGMGALQDNPNADEDRVFENVQTRGDYPFRQKNPDLYADYVFGRMMKWGCRILDDGQIEIRDMEFNPEYQSFVSTYENNNALVEATKDSLREYQPAADTQEQL